MSALSILERKNERKIVDITVNDPNNYPEINSPEEQSKSSIVDVRCTDELKRQYIIEMQVFSDKGVEIGNAEGLAEGQAKGKLEEKINIAKELLDILDVGTIAQKTGLSIKEVEGLKKNNR